MTKRPAFWHMDVKKAGLINPCYHVFGSILCVMWCDCEVTIPKFNKIPDSICLVPNSVRYTAIASGFSQAHSLAPICFYTQGLCQ